MESLAIALVILSAVLHAFRNLLTKKAMDKEIFVWWYEIFAMAFFFIPFMYILLTVGIGSVIAVYIGIAAGFVHFVYWVFLAKSYRKGDLSHVYPIMRSSPALVLVLSIVFLNEQVSMTGLIGILLVVLGIYVINMKRITLSELSAPVKSMLRERPTQFAFLTMISVAAYSLIDKVGVGYMDPIILVYLLTVFGMVFFTPYIFRVKDRYAVKNEWRLNKKSIVTSGLIVILGYSLILVAFTMERVSYVVGLRQLSVVFAVLMGGHLLKEKRRTIRLTSAILIFLGAFLISIG